MFGLGGAWKIARGRRTLRAMNALSLAPEKTALVLIDLQQGVLAMPTEPRPPADVLAGARSLAAAFRAKGAFVALVRVAFSEGEADMLRPSCDTPAPLPRPLPPGFSNLAPDLAGERDHLIVKRQWGAFHGTDLDLQLRRRGISTIVLSGIATSIGVESTARQAFELGYEQVFAEDAMASRTAAEHEHTVTRIFPRLGRVRKIVDVLAALA